MSSRRRRLTSPRLLIVSAIALVGVLATNTVAREAPVQAATTLRGVSGSPEMLYVSADSGSDSGLGTKSKPFATIERAQKAAREVASAGTRDVVVNIDSGTYVLDKTLTFNASDSGRNGFGVTYQAAGYDHNQPLGRHAEVVLSGGRKVTGWTLDNGPRNIWVADVGTLEPRQVYVNDQRAPRASISVNVGMVETPAGYTVVDATPTLQVGSWANPADIEAVWVRTAVSWAAPRCGVSSIALTEIVMDQPCFSRVIGSTHVGTSPTRRPTSFENSKSFLSEPGTQVLDTTDPRHHKLYYIPRPGEDMSQVNAVVPALERLVETNGTPEVPVRNLTFRGVDFQHTAWNKPNTTDGYVHHLSEQYWCGPVVYPVGETCHNPGGLRFRYVDGVTLEGNTFSHMGADAIEANGKNIAIVGNEITDTSGGGIILGNVQPETRDSITDSVLVANNWIHHIGEEYSGAGTGITAIQSRNITIRNNQINTISDRGIFVCGVAPTCPGPGTSGAKILNNKVFDILRVMGDGGGVYVVGPQSQTGSYETGALVSGNLIHDTDYEPDVYPGLTNGPLDFALYADYGPTYITFTDNVVYNTTNSAGGLNVEGGPLSGNGVLPTGEHIQFLDNFWVDQEPAWLMPPKDQVLEGNHVLDRDRAKDECLSIERCRQIYDSAGLELLYRPMLS
ncbi:right-handed parallel beta-helix repeat-containing protein [Paenarthrobacter sp. NPDC057981]|uniref:right-handed parallel beta-helix repeat-containing protein n=1 Tax=Paenarthrobacter sp. NPDC057981 TaxID=3346297 RepID=UPI0036DA0B6C